MTYGGHFDIPSKKERITELDNISITDTNGNVYSSMANAEDSALDKIQENENSQPQQQSIIYMITPLDRSLLKLCYYLV